MTKWDFSGCASGKNSHANAGDSRDVDSIIRLGRPPGEGHGNPLQYYFLKNRMEGIQSIGSQGVGHN